jgi:hypothetical protein
VVDVAVALVGAGATVGLAGTFLWSSLSKALVVPGFRQTLHQLGLPSGLARHVALAVVLAEFVTAGGLLIATSSWWPRAAVVILAVSFGSAAGWTIATRRRVACRCFGSTSRQLGTRHLALTPVWIGLAVIAQIVPPTWNVVSGLAILAGLLLALIAIQQLHLFPLMRTLRGDRIALAPDYAGLHTKTGGVQS